MKWKSYKVNLLIGRTNFLTQLVWPSECSIKVITKHKIELRSENYFLRKLKDVQDQWFMKKKFNKKKKSYKNCLRANENFWEVWKVFVSENMLSEIEKLK